MGGMRNAECRNGAGRHPITGEPCAGKARQHGSGRGRRKRTRTTGTSPAAYFTRRAGAGNGTHQRYRASSRPNQPPPFACLLVGQPTLRRRIKLGTFAALNQRIALRYTMSGMSDTETKSYLTHHLKLPGRSDALFSDDAVALIHQVSRGIPRAVNNLAVQALVAAFATNKTIVDESSARAAVTEVTTE